MTAAAALEPETETVVLLPVAELHKSPTQPRRRGDGKPDADFVASVKEQGVLQPIVVRVRRAGGWEIVFGHRRHGACGLAGRPTIPAIVRGMTDDQVFEAQLIENIHREDMHPLDEADGFKRMVEHGRTVQQVADKIGRPITYVAQRLKLCELGKECRKALDEEEISLGVALLIARVPASLQAEALQTVDRWDSVADVKRSLEASFLLRLDQAPFDIASATLVHKAGACTACPKRTGQQRELFPDAARADLCTDRVCYRGKVDALWQIKVMEAKAGGTAVLEGKAAEKALGYGGGYRRLDDTEWVGNKSKTVRALLGKDLPPIMLARNERTGAISEVVKSADVEKVLRKGKASARAEDKYNPQSGLYKSQEAKEKRRAAAVTLAIAAAVDRCAKLPQADFLRVVTHALVARTWNEGQKAVIRRRGLDPDKTKTHVGAEGVEGRLLKHLRSLAAPADVAGLALELALQNIAPGKWGKPEPLWAETLKTLDVDFAALERQLAAEAKAKKKTKEGKGKPKTGRRAQPKTVGP
jgi:ParB/RepB/Spo0J family partition protein